MNPRNIKLLLISALVHLLAPDRADECFEVKAFTTQAKTSLPATAARLKEIQEVDEIQKVDEECSQVRVYYLHGWPAYMPHQPLPGPY